MKEIADIYFKWKDLNDAIKQKYTRGINLHEYITEGLCCSLNGYILHASEGNSEDAVDKQNRKIQIKGTSNFYSDLSSFGPNSEFDILEFVRLDYEHDVFYFYRIDIQFLSSLKVNKKETFEEQQKMGRRPRFSIIKDLIDSYNIEYYAIVDLKNKKIFKK